MTKDAILPEGSIEQERVSVTVLGDVAHPGFTSPASRPLRDLLTRKHDRAPRLTSHPDDRLDELGLPIALNPCDAQDLTGMDRKIDVDQLRATRRIIKLKVNDLKKHLVSDGGPFGAWRGQHTADHQLSQLSGIDLCGFD